jgi:hypothetical protein
MATLGLFDIRSDTRSRSSQLTRDRPSCEIVGQSPHQAQDSNGESERAIVNVNGPTTELLSAFMSTIRPVVRFSAAHQPLAISN